MPGQKRKYAGASRVNVKRRRTAAKMAAAPYRSRSPMFPIEHKFLDTAASELAFTLSSTLASGEKSPESGCTGCLSAPAQGDGASARDGSKIIIESVYVSGLMDITPQLMTAGPVDRYPIFYVALVLDTQTNGATLNSEDVFTNPGADTLMSTMPLRNLSNSKRFRVLASKYVSFGGPQTGASATAVAVGYSKHFALSWRGKIPVDFIVGETTANVTSVSDNSIHLIAYTQANGLTPTFSYNCRVRFVG